MGFSRQCRNCSSVTPNGIVRGNAKHNWEIIACDACMEFEERKTLQAKVRNKEAQRMQEAQTMRYMRHLFDELPVQGNRQRLPCTDEQLETLITDAYDTITHKPDCEFCWKAAVEEVMQQLHYNQEITIGEYEMQMWKAYEKGEDLSQAWQKIAHHADRDDPRLKRGVWTRLKVSIAKSDANKARFARRKTA